MTSVSSDEDATEQIITGEFRLNEDDELTMDEINEIAESRLGLDQGFSDYEMEFHQQNVSNLRVLYGSFCLKKAIKNPFSYSRK